MVHYLFTWAPRTPEVSTRPLPILRDNDKLQMRHVCLGLDTNLKQTQIPGCTKTIIQFIEIFICMLHMYISLDVTTIITLVSLRRKLVIYTELPVYYITFLLQSS